MVTGGLIYPRQSTEKAFPADTGLNSHVGNKGSICFMEMVIENICLLNTSALAGSLYSKTTNLKIFHFYHHRWKESVSHFQYQVVFSTIGFRALYCSDPLSLVPTV